jgi:3-hydroxybutyryl-CoA dehydrogenase
MYDLSPTTVDLAAVQVSRFFERSVELGKLTRDRVDAAQRNLIATSQQSELAQCDVVIEAVYEDLELKCRVLADLNEICPPHTVFASNTSTLSITEIAAGSGRADRVVGLHFCLPAQLMALVEVTSALTTSAATFDLAWKLCERLGQSPVRTADTPGFVLNYFVVPFNNDAIRLVESGVATPMEIDRAIKVGMGYSMGPCELLDLIGLDTQLRLCEAFYGTTKDPRTAAPPLLRRMVAAGFLGRKTGKGFHTYESTAVFGG